MSVDAYLNFNGNCREAVLYYAEVFQSPEPKIMSFGDAPPSPEHQLPPEAKNLVMHSQLQISGSTVMFSDVLPGMPFTLGNNITLSLASRNKEELERAYHMLADGGSVQMELQSTFFSELYGQVTDRFGIQWQINMPPAQ